MSLREDEELSELETALLEHHLARCPECSREQADLRAFTEMLRTDRPQLPNRPIVVVGGRRRSRARAARRASAAAAVIAGLAAVFVSVSVLDSGREPSGGGGASFSFPSQQQRLDFVRSEVLRIEPRTPVEFNSRALS
jgi:predicted anti-sigma-YlaC factor YlaD